MNKNQRPHGSIRQIVLFAALFAIGCIYIALFTYLYANSRNFLVQRKADAAIAWAASRHLQVPQTLVFNTNSPWTAALAVGWNQPEAWGVWSQAETASLVLPAPIGASARTLCFHFYLGALTSSTTHTWPLKILINGRIVSISGHHSGPGPHEINATASIGDGPMTIEFTGPRARSPRSINGGPDSRLLSLSLFKIDISNSCR